MWNPFGFGKVTQAQVADVVARMESRLSQQDAVLAAFELQLTTTHDQVRKWMRRAEAAERRASVGTRPAAEPDGSEAGAADPPRRLTMWGARRRIAERRAAAQVAETGETNGVHS